MATLLTDLFVTVKDRYALAKRSLTSLLENTPREQFRLTVCFDGSLRNEDAAELFDFAQAKADYVLISHENEGLGPTINRAVAHICSTNEWYEHPTHGDPSQVAPFITMCQDDLVYSSGWLHKLAMGFIAYELKWKLGFASGVECIEHPAQHQFSNGWQLKPWIRAAQMMGRREYWKSMMPIPRFDPETGRVRAKPNDGMGSGVDWWLIRNHENSVCRTGRTNLVMPGLVVHAGYNASTWLQNGREMPESESDKERAREGLQDRPVLH